MISRLIRPITDVEVEEYRTNGAVCLRGMFDAAWVEKMRNSIDRLIDNPGPFRTDSEEEGRVAIETYPWLRDEGFKDYAFESPAAAIAARLLGAEKVHLLFDQFLVKEPNTPVHTSWHQDGPSWPIHGEEALSLWMALDDVTLENGGMKYARGSHKGPHYGAKTNLVRHSFDAKNTKGPFCPDFDKEFPEQILQWDVKAGDVLVHHMWTVHGAAANSSGNNRRRAHTTRWVSGNSRFQEGRFRLRQPFEHGLKEGDPMDCKLYPSVEFAL